MNSIREALIRNGIFYATINGENYTIGDGAGCYMVARDSSGLVRYRIEGAQLSTRLLVRDVQSGCVVSYLEAF